MKTQSLLVICSTEMLKKLITRSVKSRSRTMKANSKPYFAFFTLVLLLISAMPITFSLLTDSVTIRSSGAISTSSQTIPPLHTAGAYIKDPSNTTVYLRGVNYPSGFTASCAGCFPANGDWLWGACYTSLSSTSLNARLAEMQNQHFNAIRLIFNPDWWRSNSATNLDGQTTTVHIREAMLQVIQAAQQYGIYCIICPWSTNFDPISACGGSQSSFVTMWTQAAQMYGDEPNVVFELFNEPNGNYDNILNAFVAATAAIRTVSQNLVVVQYGYCGSFDFVDDYAPALQPYGNIVYSNHIYRYPAGATFSGSSGTTTSVCDSTLRNTWSYGTVIGRYPMYIGEIGAYTSQSGDTAWFTSCLSVLNSYGAGYTGWEWGQDGTNWQLSTPTTAPWSPNTNGQVLRNAIISGSS